MSDDPDKDGEKEPNALVEAIKNQYNLIGIAILSGSLLPLILAAGVELTMLPFMERYQRYRRAKQLEEEKRKRKEIESAEMLLPANMSLSQEYHALEEEARARRAKYH